MAVPAYAFYNLENVQTINELVERAKKKQSIFYFCTHEYINARNQCIASLRLIKYNQQIIENPKRFSEDIRFYLEHKDVIDDFLYRLKNKSKRIPYYTLKESLVNNINTLNGQVDKIYMIKAECVQSEEITKMVTTIELIKKFPLMAKIHLGWVMGFGLFLIITGTMDLLSCTILNIKSPAILFGLIFLSQIFLYAVNPERWTTE
jgi:hypothetical protein